MSIIKVAVKPKVNGNPIRHLDPFCLVKTILFITLISINNTFSQLTIDPKLYDGVSKDNNKEYIDGLEILPEEAKENIPVIEAPRPKKPSYIYDRNTQNLLRESLVKPMPTEETTGVIFGIIYQNGEFQICDKAPEPTINSLFLLSGLIFLYTKRKNKNNANK